MSTPSKKASTKRGVTFEAFRRIVLALPGVEEGPCYGTPGFRVKGKFLARIREDGESLVVKVGFDTRDMLMEAEPGTFYTEPHYHGYPSVLIHLSKVKREALRSILENAWRTKAPKKLVASYDENQEP